VVIDEYGSVEGIVTMADLAATVLGDEEPSVVERVDGSWLVDGMIKFDEFLDRFPLPDVAPDDFQTLAGFLIARLGRLPHIADRVAYGRYDFEIVDMDDKRIDRVAITRRIDEERNG